MLFGSCLAVAEPYEDALVRLDVPAGFQGPVSASQSANADVVAFRWPYAAGDASTLLQITKFGFGAALAALPSDERSDAAEFYLLQFLEGVARRRDAFESSEPVRLDLGGLPAAKIFWEGLAQGRRLSGIMYCVIVGTTVISFHTQDLDPVPLELREAIVTAIENVVLKRGE